MSELQSRALPHGLVYACCLVAVLILSIENSIIRSEAKEFDWSDLGVSLAGAKSNNPAGNLRIVVSPQRRSTKNYEFEYTNGTQPVSSSQGDSSYVVSNSGSPYLAQSIYQLSPNHSVGHSSAYSALSASLASLKSRLNARGVTLTSTIADANNQPSSHLYAPTNGAYSSSVLIDPSQQHSQQQQQQVQTQTQQSSQPTYLSVSSQQDPQAANPYTAPPSQGSENKTIVLAIPAKINFLTGSKQAPSQHQQSPPQPSPQAPQLSVLQSSGILGAQEGGVEQVGQVAATDPQEHQQYVIVNQPQSFSDHHSHSVAASLSPSQVGSSGQVYSTIYSQPQTIGQTSGVSMKYLPTYSQATQLQQPAVQKVYSVIDSSQLQQQMQSQPMAAQQVAPVISTYETQMVDQPISGTRYISCIDTCNSADPRWRKYTVSRYKACCSRSSQFDASFEQPSAEKVGEHSTRYADDAYYSYLQRRSRSRRSRRQRARHHSSRYTPPSSTSSSAHHDDETTESGSNSEGSTGSRTSSGRSFYEPKHYRARTYGSSSSSADLAGPETGSVSQSSKYSTKEPRASRRGRSRDFETNSESAHQADDNTEDGPAYPRDSSSWGSSSSSSSSSSLVSPSGYGSNDYSVDLHGRGYGSDARGSTDEDESGRYDEPAEMEQSSSNGKADSQEYPHDSSSDANEEVEQDPATGPSYKYPPSAYRKSGKSRRKLAHGKDQPKSYSIKKLSARKNKSKLDGHSGQLNATDYDSAQPGDHYQDSTANSSAQDQEDHGSSSASSYSSKDSSQAYDNNDSEKDPASTGKYRSSLNDTAVAHLSKTTMHLKEILSILEKKAQSSRANESFFSNQQQRQPHSQPPPQQQPMQQIPMTSTPPPPITTTAYPLSLLGSGSPYSSPISTDFMSTDLGSFKSPYKFDHTTFSSALGAPHLSLGPNFGQFGTEGLGPLTPPYPSPYSLHTGKHLVNPNGPHQRKRRVNKNARYNDLMFQKAAHGLATPSSLMHAKNRFLSPSYYPALQYPYLYRGTAPTLSNPYPYKSHHKNPYSSLLSSSMSSKLAAAANSGGLYTDESRLHGLTGLDPLANMASSLRPSAAMRLRSKPFIFQPQVLPIYTRHSILTQPLDGKA